MNEKRLLDQVIEGIEKVDENWLEEGRKYIDQLAKPVGSLGKVENIGVQLAGIQKTLNPVINKKATIVMSAANGIVEEGVAATPPQVNDTITLCMADGVSGVCALSKPMGADVSVYNIGLESDIQHSNLKDINLMKGTNNFMKEPAIPMDITLDALEEGIKAVKEHVDKGYNLLGTGEMGIGNTTTSSAVIMSLLDKSAKEVVGRGAGLSDEGLTHKRSIVEQGIKKYDLIGKDALTALSCVGGLDIAGLAGVFLGAAYYKVPVVIDGVISVAAALVAYRINPIVAEYMVSSHLTVEPAYKYAIEEIGLEPLLKLDMRLGEGSGCPFTYAIAEAACSMMKVMVPLSDVM